MVSGDSSSNLQSVDLPDNKNPKVSAKLNVLMNYFNAHIGAVEWQWNMV